MLVGRRRCTVGGRGVAVNAAALCRLVLPTCRCGRGGWGGVAQGLTQGQGLGSWPPSPAHTRAELPAVPRPNGQDTHGPRRRAGGRGTQPCLSVWARRGVPSLPAARRVTRHAPGPVTGSASTLCCRWPVRAPWGRGGAFCRHSAAEGVGGEGSVPRFGGGGAGGGWLSAQKCAWKRRQVHTPPSTANYCIEDGPQSGTNDGPLGPFSRDL